MEDSKHKIEELDTGYNMFICRLFGIRYDHDNGLFRTYFIPYSTTAFAMFGIPLFVAFVTMKSLLERIPGDVNVPYLLDWNMNCAMLISIPLLVTLIVSEPGLIASALSSIMSDKILEEKQEGMLHTRWHKRYSVINIAAQFVGIAVGIFVSYANYNAQHNTTHFYSWQFKENISNYYVSSWIFLFWQIPLLSFFCTIYVLRYITHVWFLCDLVDKCEQNVKPFHHDRCGGLKLIGQIGLRNQYMLAVIGINILLLIYTLYQINRPPNTVPSDHTVLDFDLAVLIFLAASAYLVGAPLAFFGPLFPFRDAMKRAKESILAELALSYEKIYDRVKKKCGNMEEAKEDVACIERIEKLQVIAEKFPVWPLDTRTLRSFLLALSTPILSTLVPALFGLIINWLQ